MPDAEGKRYYGYSPSSGEPWLPADLAAKLVANALGQLGDAIQERINRWPEEWPNKYVGSRGEAELEALEA